MTDELKPCLCGNRDLVLQWRERERESHGVPFPSIWQARYACVGRGHLLHFEWCEAGLGPQKDDPRLVAAAAREWNEDIAAWNTRAVPADDRERERIVAWLRAEALKHREIGWDYGFGYAAKLEGQADAEQSPAVAKAMERFWMKDNARLRAEADALKDALEPFIQEIDRLEREYGFDRPLHQGQCLMLPLSDLLNLRAALAASTPPAPEVDALKKALRDIRDRDWVENCIDSQWASRRAAAALASTPPALELDERAATMTDQERPEGQAGELVEQIGVTKEAYEWLIGHALTAFNKGEHKPQRYVREIVTALTELTRLTTALAAREAET